MYSNYIIIIKKLYLQKEFLSKKRYIYSEENNQEYKKSGTENFISSYWPIKNNNKQIQCIIPALTLTRILDRKISVITSTSNFQQRGIQSCQMTGRGRYNNFSKIIIPRRMKTNVQTQTDERMCLNCLQNCQF